MKLVAELGRELVAELGRELGRELGDELRRELRREALGGSGDEKRQASGGHRERRLRWVDGCEYEYLPSWALRPVGMSRLDDR
ncbi:hypothetical protein AB0C93_31445 [Streptomyces sp. NPDC048518]|uniref:hypothetical protein n=1 Tax=Streptomyces sp. NPDC048518 TaxID=3155029 RepID=UPI00340EA668